MDILNNWFKANQLSLNLLKTVLMCFWDNKLDRTLSVDGLSITNITVTKFLGVFVDQKLSLEEHVTRLLDKLLINKHLLMVSSNLLDKSSLKLVYHAHIQSHLVYSLSVWGSMISSMNLSQIFKAQKTCAKLACKLPKNVLSTTISKKHRLLPIQELINLELCKFRYAISHQVSPSPIQRLMNKLGGKKVHRYPTRNKSIPNIQKHSSTLFNKSFMCKGLVVYNNLPAELKENKKQESIQQKTETISYELGLNGTLSN